MEYLYDEVEKASVRYIGIITTGMRYDLSMVFTHQFYGKTLVIDMQRGRCFLLSLEDVEETESLQKFLGVESLEETKELANFLQAHLPSDSVNTRVGW